MNRLILCALLSITAGWASIIGSTDPTAFNDTVDWCVLFGCDGQALPTPEAWTSSLGTTGFVGLVDTGENVFVLAQGSTWMGDFPAGMGLIYNGADFRNTPAQVATTFDTGVFGAGAYIQTNYIGPFTARIELFDSSYQSLGLFSGTSDNQGTALFIGAYLSTADVWAAQFDATSSTGYNNPDFAIGTLGLKQTSSAVPEPASLFLLGSALLALGGMARLSRRKEGN